MFRKKSIKVSPKKYQGKGIFFGLNYNGPNKLHGCENDSRNLMKYFSDKGLECEMFIGRRPTKSFIIEQIRNLGQSSYQGIRNFVIQYSGHGTSIGDRNGDEKDGSDEALVGYDLNFISDDELFKLLCDFHPESNIISIIDACHSGSMLDLPYSYININSSEDFQLNTDSQGGVGCFKENGNQMQQKVIMISGCRDSQYSTDTYSSIRRESCGALTDALLNHGDFIELPIFNLKASVESIVSCYNQLPCVSSSFKLINQPLSSIYI